jgi:hypothetical protein
MKELPENFTDEEHAAWIKQIDNENRRTEIIGGFIGYGIMGAFVLWMLWPVLMGEKHLPDWWILLVLGAYAYYDLSKRIDKLRETIENSRSRA